MSVVKSLFCILSRFGLSYLFGCGQVLAFTARSADNDKTDSAIYNVAFYSLGNVIVIARLAQYENFFRTESDAAPVFQVVLFAVNFYVSGIIIFV